MTDIAMILLVFSLMVGCSDKNAQLSGGSDSSTAVNNVAGENIGNSIIFPEDGEASSSTDGSSAAEGTADGNSVDADTVDGQQTTPSQNSSEQNTAAATASGVSDELTAENTIVSISKLSDYVPNTIELKNKDINNDYSVSECTRITFSASNVIIEGSGAEYQEITENGDVCRLVTISTKGDYIISGSCSNGRICIEADKKDDVRLILDGVDLTGLNMAPILAQRCDKLIITLADNSTNSITDKSIKTENSDETESTEDLTEADSSDNEDLSKGTNAAIYSSATVTINGTGSLTITSENVKGIYSKDKLKLVSGSISVKAGGVGIKSKEGILIDAANVTVESSGDALKTTVSKENKGYVVMNGGSLNISSAKDGISAAGNVDINAGSINITCTGGSAKTSQEEWGRNPWASADNKNETNGVSSKGIKSKGIIYVKNGELSLTTNDDSIHSNNAVLIENGTITISAGDDAIHADNTIIIEAGKITVNTSYEGIEAEKITINGGDIIVYSNDDGMNASTSGSSETNIFGNNGDFGGQFAPDGNQPENFDGQTAPNMSDRMDFNSENRPGKNNFNAQNFNFGGFGASSSTAELTINGGNIYINSGGDGVDSNGALYINGGIVLVDGPTEDMNSAVDHDGTALISGGVLVASGSSGMIENFEEASTQNVLMVYFDKTLDANTEIYLLHNGEQILGFKNAKKSACVMISSPKLETGETYTVTADGATVCELTISSTITSNGSNTGFGGFGGRGFGGRGK